MLAPPKRDDDWVILPFDFDQAGIISTDYALPDANFSIRRVSTRLYRGFCAHNSVLADSITLFAERRDDITAALVPPELSKSRHKRALRYVDRFFETVNDPQKLQREILDKCRGPRPAN